MWLRLSPLCAPPGGFLPVSVSVKLVEPVSTAAVGRPVRRAATGGQPPSASCHALNVPTSGCVEAADTRIERQRVGFGAYG